MSSDWPLARLGDYCQKIGSGATPRGGSSVYLDEGPVSLIRSQNIYNEGFKVGGLTYIDEDASDKLKNVIVEANDVLLNITGDSVARVCLAPAKYLPARVNQHVAIIRPNPKEFDSRFIRYYLITPAMQSYLLALAGSGATRNALTKGMIEGLEIPKPDINVQREIADILSSLDDKIEVNRQINQTLEQIAQAIFKSWFVDFEPVKAKIQAKQDWEAIHPAGGSDENAKAIFIERAAMRAISGKTDKELDQLRSDQRQQLTTTAELFPDEFEDSELGEIPKGWHCTTLKEMTMKIGSGATPRGGSKAYIESGVSLIRSQNVYDSEFKWEGLAYITNEVAEQLKGVTVELNDVLFNITGASILRTCVVEPSVLPARVNQHVAIIRVKLGVSPRYIHLHMLKSKTKEYLIGMNAGGSREAVTKGHIESVPIINPGETVLDGFHELVEPLYRKIEIQVSESRCLSAFRDILLPKLLAGEIEIENKCKEVEC